MPQMWKEIADPGGAAPVFLPVLRVVAACGGVASGADCDRIDFSGAGGLQLRGCTSAGLRYRVSGRLSPFDQNGV